MGKVFTVMTGQCDVAGLDLRLRDKLPVIERAVMNQKLHRAKHTLPVRSVMKLEKPRPTLRPFRASTDSTCQPSASGHFPCGSPPVTGDMGLCLPGIQTGRGKDVNGFIDQSASMN
jgi:hypothetical protein